ncbi:unnamed protein product [Ectocarpus sp. CCAP 1310/34]|nr:unnamed protein product [Ectocarpus sp. CCAP 1310/34]
MHDYEDTPPLHRASILIDPSSATGHIVEPPGQTTSPLTQDDDGLPLSSTGERARQEALGAADAAAAEADTISIQDKMDKLKPEQLDSVTRLPLGPDADEFARFASSYKGVVTEILNKNDVKRKQTFNSFTWVTGWLPLLRKRVRAAVFAGQTTNRATLEFLDAIFLQVEKHLRKEPAGPSTYAFFIQKLVAAWDTQDKSSGIDRLRSFGVSNGEAYGEFIRRPKALAMTVTVSHHAFKPSVAQVQIAVRDSMLKQFPAVSGQVYKDEQLSMEAPLGRHASCLDDMWDALDKRAFAHTPAVHGDDFFSVSSTNARSSSPVSRAVASSALRSAVTPSWSQGSSAAVMSVDPLPNDDRDPFLLHHSDWPLQGHFQEVYNVASEMALTKNDPPLFIPLVSAEERRNALRLYKSKCLNCSGEDDSFISCNRGFVNATSLLNNDIQFCMEKDPTLWGRWKKPLVGGSHFG